MKLGGESAVGERPAGARRSPAARAISCGCGRDTDRYQSEARFALVARVVPISSGINDSVVAKSLV
jgi:hypothetical protein